MPDALVYLILTTPGKRHVRAGVRHRGVGGPGPLCRLQGGTLPPLPAPGGGWEPSAFRLLSLPPQGWLLPRVCALLSSYKDIGPWIWDPPLSGMTLAYILITSAKTLFPNEVTEESPGESHLDSPVDMKFGGHHLRATGTKEESEDRCWRGSLCFIL